MRAVGIACESDPWLCEHRVKIEWFGGQFASGQIASDHSLVELVGAAHETLEGQRAEVHGAPYGSDLRLMVVRSAFSALSVAAADDCEAPRP